jgi:hypothetical protein
LRVGRSEEQAERNERTFREANERIAQRRAELTAVDGRTPFLCECEDEACTAIVQLALEEYVRVRDDGGPFVIVQGHPTRGRPTGFEGDGWICVRKG